MMGQTVRGGVGGVPRTGGEKGRRERILIKTASMGTREKKKSTRGLWGVGKGQSLSKGRGCKVPDHPIV